MPNPQSVNEGAKIYVGGLDYHLEEANLKEIFTSFGELTKVELHKDDRGVSKGFAFLHYKTAEDGRRSSSPSPLPPLPSLAVASPSLGAGSLPPAHLPPIHTGRYTGRYTGRCHRLSLVAYRPSPAARHPPPVAGCPPPARCVSARRPSGAFASSCSPKPES